MNSITKSIADNRNLFEKIAEKQANAVSTNKRFIKYTILNYKKMLDEMCEFIDGYVSYKGNDGETYKGKVLSTTVHFYEQFLDLTQMQTISKDYLEGSKRLQKLIDQYSAQDYKDDKELKSLIALTEKQYLKIMKVHKDDMQIYLWLTSKDCKHGRTTLSPTVMSAYKNEKTPVIHEKQIK